MVWDILLEDGLIGWIVLAVVDIVMAIVYAAKYEPARLNVRIPNRFFVYLLLKSKRF